MCPAFVRYAWLDGVFWNLSFVVGSAVGHSFDPDIGFSLADQGSTWATIFLVLSVSGKEKFFSRHLGAEMGTPEGQTMAPGIGANRRVGHRVGGGAK